MIARAEAAGFVPRYGLELEYTLFDETVESARAKGYRNLKTATAHAGHDLLVYQAVQTEWHEAVADMAAALRIDLDKMHQEIGAGFMEACIADASGLAPADQAVLLKTFLRALALRQGRSVTFMPRWSETADGQSTHIHISLERPGGAKPFFDPDAPRGLSETLRHFVGGLQRHLGELSLIFLPTVNAYRRFAAGSFAPPASPGASRTGPPASGSSATTPAPCGWRTACPAPIPIPT